jgi:hypothetical protein
MPFTCAMCQTLTPYMREMRVRFSPRRTVCHAIHPQLAVIDSDALWVGAAFALAGAITAANTITSANTIVPTRTLDAINLRLISSILLSWFHLSWVKAGNVPNHRLF